MAGGSHGPALGSLKIQVQHVAVEISGPIEISLNVASRTIT